MTGRNACLLGKFDDDLEVFQNFAEQIPLKSIENGLPFDTPNEYRSNLSFYLVSMRDMEGTRILDEIRRNFTVTGGHHVVLDEHLYYFTFKIRSATYDLVIDKHTNLFLISVHARN